MFPQVAKQRTKWMDKTRKCVKILSELPELKIAYLAGIIDGEGTISFRKMFKGYFRPIIEITNTDDLLIKWLMQVFWQKPTRDKNRAGRQYFKVCLTGFGIAPFLQRLETYLVNKKLQAYLVNRYIFLRKMQRWKEPPSEEMKQLYLDTRLLNSRGKDSDIAKARIREKYAYQIKY